MGFFLLQHINTMAASSLSDTNVILQYSRFDLPFNPVAFPSTIWVLLLTAVNMRPFRVGLRLNYKILNNFVF